MQRSIAHFVSAMMLFTTILSLSGAAQAQENGYVNGTIGFFSFNPSTGSIVNSFPSGGTSKPFAVAGDDVTLYMPAYANPVTLNQVNGATGQLEGSLAILGIDFNSVALTKNGTTAFVLDKSVLSVIDTTGLTVANSVELGGCPVDLVLSPDDSTLYVSFIGTTGCSAALACPVKTGVCALNASTFALEWSVPNVFGLLSVSNDGSTLYAAATTGAKPLYPLNAINTATHAITNLNVRWQGWDSVRVAASPVSNYAVVVIDRMDAQSDTLPASAYLLNTATNKFVATVFSSAPGGMMVTNYAGGVAIAPDGRSVWMLMGCPSDLPVQGCIDNSGQLYLAGFSLPSMTQIAFELLPGQFINSNYDQSVAFPR